MASEPKALVPVIHKLGLPLHVDRLTLARYLADVEQEAHDATFFAQIRRVGPASFSRLRCPGGPPRLHHQRSRRTTSCAPTRRHHRTRWNSSASFASVSATHWTHGSIAMERSGPCCQAGWIRLRWSVFRQCWAIACRRFPPSTGPMTPARRKRLHRCGAVPHRRRKLPRHPRNPAKPRRLCPLRLRTRRANRRCQRLCASVRVSTGSQPRHQGRHFGPGADEALTVMAARSHGFWLTTCATATWPALQEALGVQTVAAASDACTCEVWLAGVPRRFACFAASAAGPQVATVIPCGALFPPIDGLGLPDIVAGGPSPMSLQRGRCCMAICIGCFLGRRCSRFCAPKIAAAWPRASNPARHFDHRVVELCMACPPDWLVTQGRTKALLGAKSLSDVLPGPLPTDETRLIWRTGSALPARPLRPLQKNICRSLASARRTCGSPAPCRIPPGTTGKPAKPCVVGTDFWEQWLHIRAQP